MIVIPLILIYKGEIKWARKFNPVLLTLSFMIEQPLIPIYDDYYMIFSICSAYTKILVVSWMVSESIAGQVIGYLGMTGVILATFHVHFNYRLDWFAIITYEVLFLIAIYIIREVQ